MIAGTQSHFIASANHKSNSRVHLVREVVSSKPQKKGKLRDQSIENITIHRDVVPVRDWSMVVAREVAWKICCLLSRHHQQVFVSHARSRYVVVGSSNCKISKARDWVAHFQQRFLIINTAQAHAQMISGCQQQRRQRVAVDDKQASSRGWVLFSLMSSYHLGASLGSTDRFCVQISACVHYWTMHALSLRWFRSNPQLATLSAHWIS